MLLPRRRCCHCASSYFLLNSRLPNKRKGYSNSCTCMPYMLPECHRMLPPAPRRCCLAAATDSAPEPPGRAARLPALPPLPSTPEAARLPGFDPPAGPAAAAVCTQHR